MGNGNLGFGLMRLPQRSAEPADIDREQLKRMVDLFLESGFDYFDTSFVYHNGGSEAAIRECLVERHPRETFRLASKLPTFAITEEKQVEGRGEDPAHRLLLSRLRRRAGPDPHGAPGGGGGPDRGQLFGLEQLSGAVQGLL